MSDSDRAAAIEPARIRVMAETLIEMMHNAGEADFAYDGASVEMVSRWLGMMAERGATPELTLFAPLAAAFAGECLRLEHGGEWRTRDGRAVLVLANGVVGDTFGMAARQAGGETEESLDSLYRMLSVFGSLSVDELHQFARGQLDLSDRLEAQGLNLAAVPPIAEVD